jgi:hypothetical protein
MGGGEFNPKPTGHVDGVQTFQTQGEDHPNCKCSVIPSDGQSPAEMLTHPGACDKCRQGAQAFNDRAQQEFAAQSQPGASTSDTPELMEED